MVCPQGLSDVNAACADAVWLWDVSSSPGFGSEQLIVGYLLDLATVRIDASPLGLHVTRPLAELAILVVVLLFS